MEELQNIANSISKIKETKEISPILKENISTFGMEYFLLGIATPTSTTRTSIIIEDNYPKGWRNYYDSNDLVKVDPIVSYCLKNHSPITWEEFQELHSTPEEKKLFKKAKEFGLAYGFSIPIHGNGNQFGMLSMATSLATTTEKLLESRMKAQLMIPTIQDTINKLINPNLTKKPILTPREIESLKWASEGKNGWEMSKIMGCSERTILFHMSNAGQKLNANNRTQSIAKAILLGYLEPSLDY